MPKLKGRLPDDPVKAALKVVRALSEKERGEFERRMEDIDDFIDAEVETRMAALSNAKPGYQQEEPEVLAAETEATG